MKIKVTAIDIKRGEGGSPSGCPVARAVRRVTNRKRVIANLSLIYFGQDFAYTPDKAKAFMKDFDFGKPVLPFEFDFNPI